MVTGTDDAEANTSWAEHFQSNYRLMTDEEKAEALDRLEKRYSLEYEKDVTVDGTDAQDGVLFGYALNIQKCIGCRRCVKACVEENNQSRGDEQEIEWIRVLKMEKGEFTQEKLQDGYPGDYGIQVGGNAYSAAGVVMEGEHYYDPKEVPEDDSHYMPVACMQCEKRARQSPNALYPMLVTESEIVTDIRAVQPENAPSPMLSTESEIVTDERAVALVPLVLKKPR